MEKLPIRVFKSEPGQWTSWMNKQIPIKKDVKKTCELVDDSHLPLHERLNNISERKTKGIPGVYVILCSVENRIYVGQSANIENRIKTHEMNITAIRKSKETCYKQMIVDFEKHGIGAFEFKIHKESDSYNRENLLKMEREAMIHYIDAGYELYNSCLTLGESIYCPTELQVTINLLIKKIKNNPSLIEKINSIIEPRAGTQN